MSDQQKPKLKDKEEHQVLEWHGQQQLLLKNWAEICSSYRWLHNQSYALYKKKNFKFMIPIIVISTVTGTANFAQSSFPPSIASFAPSLIGLLNLFAALMTTVYQYLKISELLEAHRQASINFGKLSRNITVELNLPVKDRTNSGVDFVKLCRADLDRLIEQSPYIEMNILDLYQLKFGEEDIAKPEITFINKVEIYDDQENKVGNILASAGQKFAGLIGKKKPPILSAAEKSKEDINRELEVLSKSKLVNNSMKNIKNMFNNIKQLNNRKNINIIGQDTNNDSWKEAIDLLKPKIVDSSNNIIDASNNEIDSDTDITIDPNQNQNINVDAVAITITSDEIETGSGPDITDYVSNDKSNNV